MRPLTLELEGFTAFRERTCLDFRNLDLFAVTGPTGAGKSSLIDAICYALYGRVPRVATEVASCISQGQERMQVSLEFSAGGRCYRVLRETRRKGQGNTRLEQMAGDGWQPLADRSKEVTRLIEEILGLDFEAFIRSVLLPQGQFQEFLAGSPERRRDVLERLLRVDVYKRMQARAGQRASALQGRVSEIERRLREELAEATPEMLSHRRQELSQAEAEATRLGQQVEALREASVLAGQAASAGQDVVAAADAQEKVAARLATAQQSVETADARLPQMRSQMEEVRAALETNEYDDEKLASLTGAANVALTVEKATKQLTESKRQVQGLEKQVTATAKAAESSQVELTAAQEVLSKAEAALAEEQRHDLAAALQAGLKPGDACPVCGGEVGEMAPAVAGGVEAAKQRVEQARADAEQAGREANGAATAAAVAESNLSNARKQSQELAAAVEEATSQLESVLPDAEDRSLAAIRAAMESQKKAREERSRLRETESALGRKLVEAEKALSEAKDQIGALVAESRGAEATLASARERESEARERRDARLRELGIEVPVGGGPQEAVDTVLCEASEGLSLTLTRRGRLEEQISRLERDAELAGELSKELEGRKKELDVAGDLAQMLRADKFQAYVQSEALRTLAADGSRKLLELSGGRYELEVAAGGQDFLVKDRWNADDLRSVRTLSGGETFLASLALALALAETLPGLAPGRRLALESIFLDEGFGSLDAEALDRAADALDALHGAQRMVCVVTHLPELAQRLPDRVVVSKSESGSSVAVGTIGAEA